MSRRRGPKRISDISGQTLYGDEAVKNWRGQIVERENWEPRHPQEFVRGKMDRQRIRDPRPDPDQISTLASDSDAVSSSGQTLTLSTADIGSEKVVSYLKLTITDSNLETYRQFLRAEYSVDGYTTLTSPLHDDLFATMQSGSSVTIPVSKNARYVRIRMISPVSVTVNATVSLTLHGDVKVQISSDTFENIANLATAAPVYGAVASVTAATNATISVGFNGIADVEARFGFYASPSISQVADVSALTNSTISVDVSSISTVIAETGTVMEIAQVSGVTASTVAAYRAVSGISQVADFTAATNSTTSADISQVADASATTNATMIVSLSNIAGVAAERSGDDPADIAQVIGLYNFNAADVRYQERTGASATTAAASGDPIGTLLDLSGEANHLTAPADSQRPTALTSGGRIVADCDGTDDYLGASWSANTSNMRVWLGIKTSDAEFTLFSGNASDFVGSVVDASSSTVIDQNAGSPSYLVDGAAPTGTRDGLHTAIATGSNVIVEISGLDLSNSSFATLEWLYYPSGFRFDGEIVCLVIADEATTALTADELSTIRSWMETQTGVTLP